GGMYGASSTTFTRIRNPRSPPRRCGVSANCTRLKRACVGGCRRSGRACGLSARHRCSLSLKTWLETQLARVSKKSDLAVAIRYALSRWAAMTRYRDDGRLEIDNNA